MCLYFYLVVVGGDGSGVWVGVGVVWIDRIFLGDNVDVMVVGFMLGGKW